MAGKHVIAVDLGATSGRLMDASFDGKRLQLTELHRFPNIPVYAGGTLYWDVLRIWHEISDGLKKRPHDSASIGVDTWGVDFALLDVQGNLLANPVHYRDRNRDGAMEWVFERVQRREVFQRTGIQFMQLNGLYQLAAMVRDGSPLLDTAHTLLTMPDLFNYWLTGAKSCEFTVATTLQMVNPLTGDWDTTLLQNVGIPTHFLAPIVPSGARIGTYDGTPVIAPATHDTGSAVVAVPTTTQNYAYLSSGTWSLLGLEVPQAVITDAAYDANVTNEGGYGGNFRLLKNIMGLWLIEQSLLTWREAGQHYSYEQVTGMAESVAQPFAALIDPDDLSFLSPGDMPTRIREFCARTGQPIPQSGAEVLAAIHVSMALKYRHVLEMLEGVAQQHVERLHIIGGGTRNRLLNQMTANAIGRPVYAGPAEATAMGNAIVQLIALGELSSLQEARSMLSESENLGVYAPQNGAAWDAAYERFKALLSYSTPAV